MNQEELRKYIEGKSTQSERECVVKWLDESPDNMQELLLLRTVYDSVSWNYRPLEVLSDISKPEVEIGSTKKYTLFKQLAKYAAVFAIAVLASYIYYANKETKPQSPFLLSSVNSTEGQRVELILSDGSKVWLNANSNISFPQHFSESTRDVYLNGEAYFDVTHDEDRKFIVHTSDYEVIVHGTEFNVRAYNKEKAVSFETSLLDGSVEINSIKGNTKNILIPNQKFISNGDGEIVEMIADTDEFMWKDGIISFNNLSVSEIFAKVELYYNVKFDVKNRAVLNNRYTGKFRMKDGVDHILRVLQLDHKFGYKLETKGNNSYIVIT